MIRPHTRRDRQSLVKLLGLLALFIAFIAALFYLKHRDQQIREQTWQSATAAIIDARSAVWMRVDSARGGAMAYRVEVIVQYAADGTTRQQWTTISSQPLLLEEARTKAILLKGRTCTVRWRYRDTTHLIAEIS